MFNDIGEPKNIAKILLFRFITGHGAPKIGGAYEELKKGWSTSTKKGKLWQHP